MDEPAPAKVKAEMPGVASFSTVNDKKPAKVEKSVLPPPSDLPAVGGDLPSIGGNRAFGGLGGVYGR